MANAGINLHLAEIEVDETLVKYITPASQRGTMVITAFWKKLDRGNRADLAKMKGDMKKKFKCNACAATERSESKRLALHTMSCKNMPTAIKVFAEEVYNVVAGVALKKKSVDEAVKEDDAHQLRERAEKTEGVLKPKKEETMLRKAPERNPSISSNSTTSVKSPSDVTNAALERFGFTTVSSGTKAALDQAVFEHIALTNKPFSESSSITFRRIFRAGIPGYKPPSADHIGGAMLDANYKTLSTRVKEKILDCSHATIIMDGYADGALNAIVNVLLRVFDVTRGEAETFFWRNRHVRKHQIESGEFIAKIIQETQEEIDEAYDQMGLYERGSSNRLRIIAAAGDRAANERAGRFLAAQKNLIKFDLPCLAHGLHNLVKMLCKNIPQFAELVEETQAFVKDIMCKRTIKAAFMPYLMEQNARVLCLHLEIRWGSVLEMLSRVFMARKASADFYAKEVLTNNRFPELFDSTFARKVNTPDGAYYSKVRSLCVLLSVFCAGITMAESYEMNLSMAYSLVTTLPLKTSRICEEMFKDHPQIGAKVRSLLFAEAHIVVSPAMYLAYCLDVTQFESVAITRKSKEDRQSHVRNIARALQRYCGDSEDGETLRDIIERQLDDYLQQRGPVFDDKDLGRRASKALTSIQMPNDLNDPILRRKNNIDFWRKYGCDIPELMELALVLAFLGPASADAERNFSLYGGVISNRECLTLTKRDKLVFYRHNAPRLDVTLREDREKRRAWKATSAANYHEKLRRALNDAAGGAKANAFLSLVFDGSGDYAASQGIGDEALAKERFSNSAPDYITELRFRINTLEDRMLQGGTLTLHEEEALTAWKEVLLVSETGTTAEIDDESDAESTGKYYENDSDCRFNVTTDDVPVSHSSEIATSSNTKTTACEVSISSSSSSDEGENDIRVATSSSRRVRSGSVGPSYLAGNSFEEDVRTTVSPVLADLPTSQPAITEDTVITSNLGGLCDEGSCSSRKSSQTVYSRSRARGRSLETKRCSPIIGISVTNSSVVISPAVILSKSSADGRARKLYSPGQAAEAVNALLSVAERSKLATGGETDMAPQKLDTTFSKRALRASASPVGQSSGVSTTNGHRAAPRHSHSPVVRSNSSSAVKKRAATAAGAFGSSGHVTESIATERNIASGTISLNPAVVSCKETVVATILSLPVYPCMLLSLADCATDDFGTPCYSKRGWLLPSTMTVYLHLLEKKWKLASPPSNLILWKTVIPFDSYAAPDGLFCTEMNALARCISESSPIISTSSIVPCSEFTVVLLLLCLLVTDDLPTVVACFTLFNGNVVIAVLDSAGNCHGAKAPAFKEVLEESLRKASPAWRGNVIVHKELTKTKTYQAEPYKDAGLVCIDILDVLLESTSSAYISSCKLVQDNISRHIYHCFEQKLIEGKAVSFKWSTVKERRTSRAVIGAHLFQHLEWLSFDEKLAVTVRRHLKIPRPSIMVKSVYASLRLRNLHDQYSVVPLTKVLSFKKGRIANGRAIQPSGYALSKNKLVGLLSDSLGTDRFRLAVWYNEIYGFICPKFRDFQKHKKDVITTIGGLKDDGSSDSAASMDEGGDEGARPLKKRKVDRMQGLKVFVDFDEGFDDDETGFYNLFAQNYGSMFMLPKSDTGEMEPFSDTEFAFLRGSWVVLERVYETAEALVASGRQEETMLINRVRPFAVEEGERALCFDMINYLWRECTVVSVDITSVPPSAKVKFADTNIDMDVMHSQLRVI